MAADRVQVVVWVYLSTTLNTRVHAQRQPVMPAPLKYASFRYSLEQSDGECLRPVIDPLCLHALSFQPAPRTALQDRFVRDSIVELSKHK